jgi:4'-phosphopantetheinyl transferase EntD
VRTVDHALSALLPHGAIGVTVEGEGPLALRPEEEMFVCDAGELRRSEFARGRSCAHRALVLLGHDAEAIGTGGTGEPLWPPAVVGSITHTQSFAAAAVALEHDLAGLGVDAEPHEPLSARVLAAVARPAERTEIFERHARAPEREWARILFSAKEAAFKASAKLSRLASFEAVIVSFDAHSGFWATWHGAPERAVTGRWCTTEEFVLCAAWVTNDRERAR